MNKYDHRYNSADSAGFKTFQLASGYVSTTRILFEAEALLAVIEAKGVVEFFDCSDRSIAVFDIPAQTGGREVYETVSCGKVENTLVLKFPIVEWIDNYPNCDGEHDRWDSRIIGHHTLIFDPAANEILFQST